MTKIKRADGTLRKWRLGDPYTQNHNPSILEGCPAIATFLGKSYDTTLRWIKYDGLPATKWPNGSWVSHKGLIMQWMLAGNHAELRGRARYALEKGTLIELAERINLPPEDMQEVFGVRTLSEYINQRDAGVH